MEDTAAARTTKLYSSVSPPDIQGLVHRISQPQDSEMLAIAAAKYMKLPPSFDHELLLSPPMRHSRRRERVTTVQ